MSLLVSVIEIVLFVVLFVLIDRKLVEKHLKKDRKE